MTASHVTAAPPPGEPGRAWPQLGDLALDIAKQNQVGVVVGVPGEDGSQWLNYRLQPLGDGPAWSARADASTLQHVSDAPTTVGRAAASFHRSTTSDGGEMPADPPHVRTTV